MGEVDRVAVTVIPAGYYLFNYQILQHKALYCE